MLKMLISGISELIYPPHCILCKTSVPASPVSVYLCSHCRAGITHNSPPFCPRCSRHRDAPITHAYCRQCQQTQPAFDFVISACLYKEPLKTLIHQFKYAHKTFLRKVFTGLIIEFIDAYSFDIAQFDLLIPIPLSATRLRERGYNQAELLAEGIARHFSLPIDTTALIRQRHSASQTMLPQKERWTNIQGAFRIKHLRAVKNKKILIIDDLFTTGATAAEAAHTLKAAGADRIGVLTLAITTEKEHHP